MGEHDRPEIIPIGHVSPYKKIDPSHPGRKGKITYEEWKASEAIREPDAEVYDKHTHWTEYAINIWWELKEKYR